MSKRNKKAKNHRKNEITKGIFTVLEKEPNKSFNYKQIAAKIDITDAQDRNMLIQRLNELKEKKRILETDRGLYKVLENTKTYHEGTVDLTGKGNAYIIVEGMDDDVFIPSNKINKAFHKDKVEVYIYPRKNSKKLEGEVVKVLERYKTTFVGIVDFQKTFAFVRPTDFRMYTDIFVSQDKMGGAKHGEKVLVEINDWPDNVDSPYGTVTEVLGMPGEHDTEIHSILAEYGLPYSFPVEVQQFADELDTSIKQEEIAKRRDVT